MPPEPTERSEPTHRGAPTAALASSTGQARLDLGVPEPPEPPAPATLPPGFQALIDAMPGAVWLVEPGRWTIAAANAGAGRVVGDASQSWVGRPVAVLAASPEDLHFWNDARAGLSTSIESETFALRGTTAVPVTRKISRIDVGAGVGPLWVVAMQDRSEPVAAQRELSLAAADLRATLESTHDGLLVTDLSGRIRNFNRRFATLWGLPADLLVRGDDDAVFEAMRRAVVDPPGYMRRLAAIDDAEAIEATDVLHLLSGRIVERIVRPQLACGRPIGRVASFRDVTASVDAEHRVQALAYADALTGLPNRRLLRDRLVQSLALERRHGIGFGLLSIDLDHFADVNLQLGRRTADDLLREAAERIQACLRQVDTVARIGSDEFAVLAQQTDEAGAEMAAVRVVAALGRPFVLADGRTVGLGASIGIVLSPIDGTDVDTLLDRARAAMRDVKGSGRAGFRFWRAVAMPAGSP